MLSFVFLFSLCCGHHVLGLHDCTINWRSMYARVFVHEDRPVYLQLPDNMCSANLVPGAWCAWEPLETGHGVTSCQSGLNIRWRRRVCSCPPPKPIDDISMWCTPERNSSAVAQLNSSTPLTRLEALKSDIWVSLRHWKLQWPFRRVSPVTNSLLGCVQFDDCYFHTGESYRGTMSVTQFGSGCHTWTYYRSYLTSSGLTPTQVQTFFASEPKNYCRNPFATLANRQFLMARLKPWCITGEVLERGVPTMTWAYCTIRHCGSNHYYGTYIFPMLSESFARMMKSSVQTTDRSYDMNAESCFETCRFRCDKYAAMNFRRVKSKRSRCCQCFNEEQISSPAIFFKDRNIDLYQPFPKERHYLYNERYKFHHVDGPFTRFEWSRCYLYNTEFSCPYIDDDRDLPVFASVFELALPRNCYETNHLMAERNKDGKSIETMTVYGTMGDFETFTYFASSVNGVLMSSRQIDEKEITTMCSHRNSLSPGCPIFDGDSRHDPNSYFNNVVDADYHWVIFDIGFHERIALIKLEGNKDDLLPLEVFIRSAPLPNWLSESRFTSSTGETGHRTEYYRRATMSDQMLWWRCEDVKVSGIHIYAECSPHQRTRWIMLRMKLHTDMLELKYSLGYIWTTPVERCCIKVKAMIVLKMVTDGMNCIVMHHPPMGPENADYWEDLYSFDADGQPVNPMITPVHRRFSLPLLTHDSIHPDDKFIQEDWDVEPCGDWEMMDNIAIVGVPAKLKITFTASDPRGGVCILRNQTISPDKKGTCQRAVYFRVNADASEVLHYPDFGRSYDLTGSLRNCQFVCAVARECKAFEFSPKEFCRLHLISYNLDTMFVYAKNVVYGRKSDIMRTTNPFTWNNPFHPYYSLLQDVLNEAKFSH